MTIAHHATPKAACWVRHLLEPEKGHIDGLKFLVPARHFVRALPSFIITNSSNMMMVDYSELERFHFTERGQWDLL